MQQDLFGKQDDQATPEVGGLLDAIVSKPALIYGDCLEIMRTVPAESIDLTVTSPPYDNLRTYNGNNEQWGEHVWKQVIAELYRVTKQGGVVVWVVGDATVKGSETGTSFKQALWAMECGFRLHDTMIYANDKPPLTHNRYEQEWEYCFVFAKGRPKAWNPIKVPSKHAGITPGGGFRECDDRLRGRNKRGPVAETKIKGNIWRIPNHGGNGTGHPAPFPLQLAADHIASWSNPGDVVLDCFMGSGTTGVACKNLGRSFIGIELDDNYYQIATKRIEAC